MFADDAWKVRVGDLYVKDFAMEEEGKFEWRGSC